jgi:hypothetical protein
LGDAGLQVLQYQLLKDQFAGDAAESFYEAKVRGTERHQLTSYGEPWSRNIYVKRQKMVSLGSWAT